MSGACGCVALDSCISSSISFFLHEIAPYLNLGSCRVVDFSLDHPMFLNTCLQRGAMRYNEKLAVLTYVTKNGFLYF